VITIARVYDKQSVGNSIRILVDRVWARGISKEEAGIDLWMKEIAPSSELRKWYNHEDLKWLEFKKRYFAELDEKRDIVRALLGVSKGGDITLLFSARNRAHNNAVALKEYLDKFLHNKSTIQPSPNERPMD